MRSENLHPKLMMGWLVRGISTLQGRALRAAGLDLTPQQATVVAVLDELGAQPVQALSTLLDIDQSAITRLVDRLEDKELVKRARSRGDGRVVNVALTPSGREIAVAARHVIEDLKADLLVGIDAEELGAFWHVLEQMRASVAHQLSVDATR